MGQSLLISLGESRPNRVIDAFIARLRRQAVDESGRYDAVPYHEAPGDLLGNAEGEERERLLSRLIAEGRELPSTVHREFGKLYWSLTVAGVGHDDIDDEVLAAQATNITAGLAVLTATTRAEDAPVDLLEDIFFEMPWQLALARLDVIATLLGDVEDQSVSASEAYARGVLGAVIFGGLHGRTMGQESPRVRRTREAAHTARDRAARGSQAWKLFSDMVKWAEREAADDRKEDEEAEWR
jgi:hypothetical protein